MKFFKKINEMIHKKDSYQKLISLFLAFCIWYYVNDLSVGEFKFRVPLEVTNLSSEYIITEFEDKFITIIFKGDKEEINLLNKKIVTSSIDLKKPVLNEPAKYPIQISRSEIPENIDVYAEKESVFLKIEKKIIKEVKVNPVFQGQIETGYLTGSADVNPEKVKISGPESLIENIESIDTLPIILTNRTVNVNEKFKLKSFDDTLVTFMKDNDFVEITLPIYESKSVTKLDLPVKFKNWPKNITAVSENISIQVYLKMKSAKSNQDFEENISAIIDYFSIDKRILTSLAENETVTVTYPVSLSGIDLESFTVLSLVPANIKLTIKKEGSK